jgi:glycosyltransferase involved in cell wall biosynthesis
VRPFRILHVLRAPVGGLFRHVVDLAAAQAERGHAVGVIADSTTGDARAAEMLAGLDLALGLTRVPMSRNLGFSDFAAARHVAERAGISRADVLHGHGAKGGAYARLARGGALRVYTPHGGSLHYSRATPVGFLYLTLEQVLARRTDLFVFESEYGRDVFAAKIGKPSGLARVVHNGVRPAELEPAPPAADACDFVYVGEMRNIKGVDVLLAALAELSRSGWSGKAVLYGDGPERAAYEARAAELRLVPRVEFRPPRPAREAFRTGRVLVIPSKAESLPYIVLEAAAGSVPMVASNVGGIPEIYGPDANALVPPDNPAALAAAMRAALAGQASARTQRLRARIAASFTVAAMTEQILNGYAAAASARASAARDS